MDDTIPGARSQTPAFGGEIPTGTTPRGPFKRNDGCGGELPMSFQCFSFATCHELEHLLNMIYEYQNFKIIRVIRGARDTRVARLCLSADLWYADERDTKTGRGAGAPHS